MPRQVTDSATRRMPAVLEIMPGVLTRMPRRSAISNTVRMPGVLTCMPGELARMPRRSADSGAGWMPGYGCACLGAGRVQPHGACLGCWRACLVAACGDRWRPPAPPNPPFQPTAPAGAPKIVGFSPISPTDLWVSFSQGRPAERQSVGRTPSLITIGWMVCGTPAPAGVPVSSDARDRMLFWGMRAPSCATGVAPNMAFQRSGGIGPILAVRRGKKAYPIYQRDPFPPPR